MPLASLFHYLRFPLRFSPLCLIVLFAIVLTGAEFSGLFGVFTFTLIGACFFKYGFTILDDIVDGRTEPPVFWMDLANAVDLRSIGLLLLIVAMYSSTEALRGYAGDMIAEGVRMGLLALVPAMIGAMSVTGSVLQALNPIAVFGTLIRIPRAYGMLLVVIGSLWLLASWILRTSDFPTRALGCHRRHCRRVHRHVSTHGVDVSVARYVRLHRRNDLRTTQ
jgi:hypothetical protein